MTGKEILTYSGTIGHQQAIEKAKVEYDQFKIQIKNQFSNVERDFVKQIDITGKK